jgi:septum site-determining protein MinD
MQRVIGVLSGKGGVGKTVTAINLAGALHEFGRQATVVDADISSANLTVHLGLPDASVSLQDVLSGKAHIYKAIRVVPRGLRIVPAALSLEKSMADMSNLKKVIRGELEGTTIIDAPPGFSKDIYHVIDACDDVVVVTNPDVPSITDAVKVIEISNRMKKNNLGVIVTRVRRSRYEISPSEIETVLDVPLLGTIPEDDAVRRSIFDRTPLVFHSPHSNAAIGYRRVAAKLADIDYEPPSMLMLRRLLSF